MTNPTPSDIEKAQGIVDAIATHSRQSPEHAESSYEDDVNAVAKLLASERERDEAVKALDGRVGTDNPLAYVCEQYIAAEDALPDEFDTEDYSLSNAVESLRQQRNEAYVALERQVEQTHAKKTEHGQAWWYCPACFHLMTEAESKAYQMCPTGIHAVAHEPATAEKLTDELFAKQGVVEAVDRVLAENHWIHASRAIAIKNGTRKLRDRIAVLEGALDDCLKVFTECGKTTLVTEERQEAWKAVLKGGV